MAARLTKVWIVSWRMPDGRRVPPRTPGAVKRQTQSRKWYGEDIPGQPARKRVPLATDKTVAARMLADLVERGERGQAGMTDLAQARRPLAEHAAEYVQAMLDKGDTPKHAAYTRTMVAAVIEGCNWRVMGDVRAAAVTKWLGEQRRRKVKPFSIDTANHYLTAIKSFSAWLAGPANRTAADPLKHLSKSDPELDRKRLRRALSWDEVEAILAAARASAAVFRGLDGAARATIYMAAGLTGFRRSELAALTPGWFDLDGTPPTVRLPARVAKNRKKSAQPIPAMLADAIRARVAAAKIPPAAPLWPGTWSERAVAMLRLDLAAAGVEYVTDTPDGPEYADLHSFRHTFVTWLMEVAGATVGQAQAFARHSDPRLTIGRYTHTDQQAMGRVVERIGGRPAPPAPADEVAALRARVAELEAEIARLKGE